MKKILLVLVTINFLICGGLCSQRGDLVIRDINYIEVEEGTIKQGDILIRDGLIQDVNKNIRVNPSTEEINGKGKWLIPGLIDAHIHFFQSGGIYTRPDALDLTAYVPYEEEIQWLKDNASDLLKRYLRCGITTVVDVGGPMYNYELRDKFNKLPEYPNIFLTGPLISTYQPEAFKIDDPPIIRVQSISEAVDLVQKQIPFKPDFIKIWYITLPTQTAESTYEIVEATIKESHRNGLKVAVHATQLNTAKLAIKAGADILVHSVDEPIDEDFTRMLLENDVAYIPSMVVSSNYTKAFGQNPTLTTEDFQFANPYTVGTLFDSKHFPTGHPLELYQPYIPEMQKRDKVNDSIKSVNLKMLSTTDALITTGTDAGNIGTLHASSYYDEIQAMKDAGLSNAHILAASTINGARALGKEKVLGSIKSGKIADLIILNTNPLDDIQSIKDIAYIIKDGIPLSADSILIETPASLVQKQVNGYNAGDIDAFLEPYADSLEIYNFPNEISGKGKDNIRPQYESMFSNLPDLHCEILNRMAVGNKVIDHERITGIPNIDYLEAIAIYTIQDGKIVKVHFISQE